MHPSKIPKLHLRHRRLYVNAGMAYPRCYVTGGLLDVEKGRLSTTGVIADVTCKRCKALDAYDRRGQA